MQPDPFSPPPEEKQPEPVSPVQGAQPAPSPVPVQQVPRPQPAPVPVKKPSRAGGIAAIILGIFVVILLVISAGLGFWAYSLNTKLTATQQQLSALQAEHTKLQSDHTTLVSDHEKTTNDLTQTKSDLEKANADLATAQADLKTAQDQNQTLSDKISKASKLADILYLWFTSKDSADIFKIDTQVKATGNAQVKAAWDKATTSASTDNFVAFMVSLATAIRDTLK